jgi:hypothetical protein
MSEFIKWVTAKFQQPLPLLFFALGAVLLLLGVTTGVDLPVIKKLTPDVNYRWISVALGAVFILLAIFLYYFPPKPVAIVRPKLEGEEAGNAMERFAILEQDSTTGPTQQRILAIMVETVCGDQLVRAEEIRQKLRQKIDSLSRSSDSELYYRMEQLLWMGFLSKKTIGRDNHLYGVSDAYQKYVHSRDKQERHE